MTFFCCPVCGGSLKREQGSLYCEKRHCFDYSRYGYVNLLTADRMHSKAPGDDRRMVAARNAFLEKGHYGFLQQALCRTAAELAGGRPVSLLDAGCGEGYYTAALADSLGGSARVLGVDISKTALRLAARRTKAADFAVASVFHLPLADESVQLLTELFAPFCREEYHRVLSVDGCLIMAIPGREHLMELKQAVYQTPYYNEVKPYELAGFTLRSKEELRQQLRLCSGQEIQDLFWMTPYGYKTSKEDAARLAALTQLETTACFELLVYQKTNGVGRE